MPFRVSAAGATAMPRPFSFALIHRSAWKGNSQKFPSRILHRSPSESREDGFWGHSRSVRGIYILWSCIDMRDLDSLTGDDLAAVGRLPATLCSLGWKLQSGEE